MKTYFIIFLYSKFITNVLVCPLLLLFTYVILVKEIELRQEEKEENKEDSFIMINNTTSLIAESVHSAIEPHTDWDWSKDQKSLTVRDKIY